MHPRVYRCMHLHTHAHNRATHILCRPIYCKPIYTANPYCTHTAYPYNPRAYNTVSRRGAAHHHPLTLYTLTSAYSRTLSHIHYTAARTLLTIAWYHLCVLLAHPITLYMPPRQCAQVQFKLVTAPQNLGFAKESRNWRHVRALNESFMRANYMRAL